MRAPLDKVVVASPFLDPNRTGLNTHFGVDLAGSAGDVVRAPEGMTIVDVRALPDVTVADNTRLTQPDGNFDGYGPGIVLGHGDSGKFHLLAHVSPAGAAVGERVDEGDPVGELVSHVGSASPHVHWEVRTVAVDTPGTRAGNTVDPMSLVGGVRPQPPRGVGGLTFGEVVLIGFVVWALMHAARH